MYEQFQKGNITVRQTEGRFNGVWSDVALQQTSNKGKISLRTSAGVCSDQIHESHASTF